jgi:hypothetical protein
VKEPDPKKLESRGCDLDRAELLARLPPSLDTRFFFLGVDRDLTGSCAVPVYHITCDTHCSMDVCRYVANTVADVWERKSMVSD